MSTTPASTHCPPVPPAKPTLSSPGAYMANFTSSATIPATAGIHSVNKSHEKPAIAARPIPPPTLPKYSASFNKVDRERNEFGKLDRAEREKVKKKTIFGLVFSFVFGSKDQML